jgi:hypothetical protein
MLKGVKKEEPCCVCGEWFPVSLLTDVSQTPIPKDARRFLNTTLDVRFLCRDFSCQRKLSGEWGAQGKKATDHDDPARHGPPRRDFFLARPAPKNPRPETTPNAIKERAPPTKKAKKSKPPPPPSLPYAKTLLTSFLLTGGASKPGSPGTDGPIRSAAGCAGDPGRTGPDAPSSKTPGHTPE